MPPSDEPRIIVVFRNDDPSACSDVEHERRVFALFEKYAAPQTLGVIPRCTMADPHDKQGRGEKALDENPAMVRLLRDYAVSSGSEIALHGYTHRTNRRSIPSRREYSEFSWLPCEEQRGMLADGLDIVERCLGVRPVTFIPPWNRLDPNTVAACAEVGLSIVSADMYTPVVSGTAGFGTNSTLYDLPRQIKEAAAAKGRVFLHVLFHSLTTTTSEDLERLEHCLKAATQTPGCRVMTCRDAVAKYGDEIRVMNEAARNVMDQTQIHDPHRGRSAFYGRVFKSWGMGGPSRELFRRASGLYSSGEYKEAAAIGPKIDAQCRMLLTVSRVLLPFLAFCFMYILISWARRAIPSHSESLAAASLAAVFLAFLGISWKATALETRRESLIAGFFALAGGLLGLGVVAGC